MTRETRTQMFAGVALALCMFASVNLAIAINGMAGARKLAYTDRAEEGQPWEVSAGIAMGAFRGIFVNFLWMRANDLKEAGKFYESVQLADIITRLQPRFPRVWVFHAWNLAYNISVATQTREERWNWVKQGIELLRDRAIPANPNDMLIHKELGWIFLHKIGGYTDDANPYYKRQLAQEWTVVLGPPPPHQPEDRDRAFVVKKYATWLRAVAEAPLTFDEAVKKEPSVADLGQRLVSAGVVKDFRAATQDEMFNLLGRYELWEASKRTAQAALFQKDLAGPKLQGVGHAIEDPAMAKAWPVLLAHVRRRLLIEKYHMEPDRMVRYTEEFGPLDWRHHGSHALYWGQRGVEVGLARRIDRNRTDFDFVNTDRIVAQAVQELFRSGEVYFDFFASATNRYAFLQEVPNVHFIEPYGQIMEAQRSRSEFDRLDARGFSPLSAGYENFLRDAICFLYRRGDVRGAVEWQRKLITYYGVNINDPYRAREVSLPIGEFVDNELKGRATSPSVAVAQVSGSLIGAFTSGLMAGDQNLFLSQFNYAKQAHRFFFEDQYRRVQSNPDSARMEVMDHDFRVVAGTLFAQFIQAVDVDNAERMYDRAPDDLKRWAYDELVGMYKQSFDDLVARAPNKANVRTFAQVFPEPDGMAAHRAFIAQYLEQRTHPTTDIQRQ